MDFSTRLHSVIPGGAHTYSRGDDQYPSIAPQILERGEGAYVYSPDGHKYLDYGMSLRAVLLGYSNPDINAAAYEGMLKGNNLTRASVIELEAAELFVSLIDSADMVKFTKNGSTATSAAVKLARAYTGRNLIARCAQHPFFSYDDWFIGSTPITKGIPRNIIDQTKLFSYNDMQSLESLVQEYPDQIACVILEPAASEEPAIDASGRNFLQRVQEFCAKNGIVFILDEMITGFRWHLKGAQHVYNVEPDLCTFGKAMANGFSVAAVAGKREIMQQGSIDKPGAERLFLLSTTHGAEMCGLAAFIRSVKFLQDNPVIEHIWSYGQNLCTLMNQLADEAAISNYFTVAGPAANPYYVTRDADGNISLEMRTLFSQEMIRHGVLMPWMAFSWKHRQQEMEHTKQALQESFSVYAKAIKEGASKFLSGPVIRPVFRTRN